MAGPSPRLMTANEKVTECLRTQTAVSPEDYSGGAWFSVSLGASVSLPPFASSGMGGGVFSVGIFIFAASMPEFNCLVIENE